MISFGPMVRVFVGSSRRSRLTFAKAFMAWSRW
jgi:hypothetical protein